MEGAWQHVAKGFSVTRDGSQMISVMRDHAQVGHEMPQGPRLTTAYWKPNYILFVWEFIVTSLKWLKCTQTRDSSAIVLVFKASAFHY